MTDVRQGSALDSRISSRNGTVAAPPRPRPSLVPGPGQGFAPRVDNKDPRYIALRNFAISMTVFNILGYAILGFEQPWIFPILAVLIGYTVEIGIEMLTARVQNRPPAYAGHGGWGMYTFLLPTHITALAVNMLLYANDRFAAIAFGVVVAIGQKAILRAPINGKTVSYTHLTLPTIYSV